jgi:hypothetical protein
MRGHPDKSIYGTYRENLMSVVGFITGLAALLVLLLTIMPFMLWINWLNIPLAVIGLAFSLIGTFSSSPRVYGIAGIIICCAVIIFGALRLKACGGFL